MLIQDLLERQLSAAAEFDRVWPILEPAVERRGEHNKLSVWLALQRGSKLWQISDRSAAVTEVIQYPSGLRVGNAWLAAGDLNEICVWSEQGVEWARSLRCSQARIHGRAGWEKVLPGFKPLRTVLVRDIT